MKKTLLILLLFITSTAQAERRTVKVVDRAPPRKALTDVNGHLMVENSGIKTDVDGHLMVEHTRAMTNSKKRSRATDDLDRMLEAMLREAQWEKQLEQMYHEFFGGRGDFPIYEKYEYEWSSGDTEDVEPSDNDDYTITITDGD
ncbi:MAG: hypothetical protein VXB01_08060 [Opitutae bacterium]